MIKRFWKACLKRLSWPHYDDLVRLQRDVWRLEKKLDRTCEALGISYVPMSATNTQDQESTPAEGLPPGEASTPEVNQPPLEAGSETIQNPFEVKQYG